MSFTIFQEEKEGGKEFTPRSMPRGTEAVLDFI